MGIPSGLGEFVIELSLCPSGVSDERADVVAKLAAFESVFGGKMALKDEGLGVPVPSKSGEGEVVRGDRATVKYGDVCEF